MCSCGAGFARSHACSWVQALGAWRTCRCARQADICRCNPDLVTLECSRGRSKIGTLLAMRLQMHGVEVQTQNLMNVVFHCVLGPGVHG